MNDLEKFMILEKVLLLKSLSIFSDTPENILADLASLMQESEFEKDAEIFKQGDFGDCLYIIYKGEVSITKEDKVLATLKEKDFFGELSVLDAETRSANAIAKKDCFLFKITQEPLYELMATHPDVARGFLKILCKRLRAANRQ